MALRVSTTGSNVPLDDLGIVVTHPTTNRDLSLEFTAVELRDSEDLTAAIQAGTLDVDDGTNFIHKDDYDPDEVLIQQLDIRHDELYISHNELRSVDDIEIADGVFPLALSSTANATKNVYASGARWITWQLEDGDIVEILGCAASGIYTVSGISDQQNFTVAETIPDSTGGTISVFHPTGAGRVGVDPGDLGWTSSTDLQTVLEDLSNTASGIHREYDHLVHNIAEDSYDEVTYTGAQVTNLTTWTDSGKTTKIREEQYTYTGSKIDTVTVIQYDAAGVEVERYVETYTYTGSKITSIDREYN